MLNMLYRDLRTGVQRRERSRRQQLRLPKCVIRTSTMVSSSAHLVLFCVAFSGKGFPAVSNFDSEDRLRTISCFPPFFSSTARGISRQKMSNEALLPKFRNLVPPLGRSNVCIWKVRPHFANNQPIKTSYLALSVCRVIRTARSCDQESGPAHCIGHYIVQRLRRNVCS